MTLNGSRCFSRWNKRLFGIHRLIPDSQVGSSLADGRVAILEAAI